MSEYLDSFHFVSDFSREVASITDEDVRRVIPFPKVGVHAQANAHYSAQLLEEMRVDLGRCEHDFRALCNAARRKRDEINALKGAIGRSRG